MKEDKVSTNFSDKNSGVSVIICCYNSASRIVPTLQHLLKQKFKETLPCEVIIVNNNSKDNLVEVVNETWNSNHHILPLKIVDQPIPGLSFAREKGIEVSSYEFLLFCDDDNWLDENYIESVFKIMSSNKEIGALGGYGIPYYEKDPAEIIIKYAGTYATGLQRKGTGEVDTAAVYGAGCTYRKTALVNLFNQGFKYRLSGRKGSVLLAGEDHELCYALFLSGYKIWASEELKFYHFIPKERISSEYIEKNIIGFTASSFTLNVYKLIVRQAEKKSNSIKNSWGWVLVLKFIFFIRGYGKDLIRINSVDTVKKCIIKADWAAIKYFFFQRKTFYNIYQEIYESAWINPKIKSKFN